MSDITPELVAEELKHQLLPVPLAARPILLEAIANLISKHVAAERTRRRALCEQRAELWRNTEGGKAAGPRGALQSQRGKSRSPISCIEARMTMKSTALILLAALMPAMSVAEIVRYPGTGDAIPHDKYVRVVREADARQSTRTDIKSRDGRREVSRAAIRKPKGSGPFPAIIGVSRRARWTRPRSTRRLVTRLRTGGPVWERFLQEGFVVVVADYRGGDMNSVSTPAADKVTAIDDGIAVIEHVKQLAYVDAARISLYGVSLGGNLVLFLASKVPALRSIVAGAPAPIWLGHTIPANGPRPDFAKLPADEAITKANIAAIATPILIQVGTADRLLELDQVLHEQLVKHGKKVRMEIYEHGYHDFVLGPQGQQRRDMPQGEYLMQGTLDALERSVKFVKTGL